jgi:hypothetical protein
MALFGGTADGQNRTDIGNAGDGGLAMDGNLEMDTINAENLRKAHTRSWNLVLRLGRKNSGI